MKVLVCGTRSITDEMFIYEILNDNVDKISELIVGGAIGVDSIAETWGLRRGIKVSVYKPDWKSYGKSAGMRRNIKMLEVAEYVIAIWNGKSRGTKHTIDNARNMNIPYQVYLYGANK
jgi:hypothetical protein